MYRFHFVEPVSADQIFWLWLSLIESSILLRFVVVIVCRRPQFCDVGKFNRHILQSIHILFIDGTWAIDECNLRNWKWPQFIIQSKKLTSTQAQGCTHYFSNNILRFSLYRVIESFELPSLFPSLSFSLSVGLSPHNVEHLCYESLHLVAQCSPTERNGESNVAVNFILKKKFNKMKNTNSGAQRKGTETTQ